MREEPRGNWYLLTGLIIGLAAGLLYSLVFFPLRYSDTEPSALSEAHKSEYRKLIALAAGASPPAFRKLFRLPDHVYYSHRRHVTVAKLPCERCHGAIADTTAPPSRPLVRVGMATCTGCHTRVSVRTDCTDCHR